MKNVWKVKSYELPVPERQNEYGEYDSEGRNIIYGPSHCQRCHTNPAIHKIEGMWLCSDCESKVRESKKKKKKKRVKREGTSGGSTSIYTEKELERIYGRKGISEMGKCPKCNNWMKQFGGFQHCLFCGYWRGIDSY